MKMNKDLNYKLIITKRKTIALIIDKEANLIVRAPGKAPIHFIEKLIKEKQDWIIRKKSEISTHNQNHKKNEFIFGEQFYFLGNKYPLLASSQYVNELIFEGDSFKLSPDKIHLADRLFIRFYYLESYIRIYPRVQHLSKLTGYIPGKIRISNAKRKWGSCSTGANINLSWRLVMLPPEIADYIIIHELVHISEMNHSDRFWAKVSKFCPDYMTYRKWLRVNSRLFDFQ